jgi:hypothetical protein
MIMRSLSVLLTVVFAIIATACVEITDPIDHIVGHVDSVTVQKVYLTTFEYGPLSFPTVYGLQPGDALTLTVRDSHPPVILHWELRP